MRGMRLMSAAMLALALPGWQAARAEPWMGNLMLRDPVAAPEGRPGNYGTIKYFIDEAQGEHATLAIEVEVQADGRPPGALEVQAFSNLNRRDHAKVWESPDAAGGTDSYYMTYPMAAAGTRDGNLLYRAELPVERTGAYRLTARFRIDGGPWRWHNDFEAGAMRQRDAAIVVSPRKVLDLTLYEAAPFVVEAQAGGGEDRRSTLEDFLEPDADGFDPFSLDLVRDRLGFNALWLMPIFPNTRERWDPDGNRWLPNASPGSPYAARDYWSVDPRLAEAGTAAAAMDEFRQLVQAADQKGLDVFIDVAFNHAGHDVVMGQGAVDLGLATPAEAERPVRELRPAWATSGRDYRAHASGPDDLAHFAPADRLGEHRWLDAGMDWFFGDYAALGPKPGADTSNGGALDERDLLYTDLDPAGGHDSNVEDLWRYFAHILPYWLDRTNGGLDGIRADFAQGLPPQAWEYIINTTRQRRWDFVFLAEALDPDPVRYRVNRQFDLITTVDHWLYRRSDLTMGQLVGSLDGEAQLYGAGAAVLHNGTSHDEEGNGDAWLMTARYAVAAALQGVPMVYMGQPLGVPGKVDFQNSWASLEAEWNHADPEVLGTYRRINAARARSPALRSRLRHFLTRQVGGGFRDDIFSAARWTEQPEVVLAFVNLRNQVVAPETFAIPDAVPLDPAARYQAFNLLANDPDTPLWPQARSGGEIRRDGVYVRFSLPNEAQYLQLRRAE